MVIVELQGGLGNQLFQYAAALTAAHGDRTSIVVDRKYYWYVRNRTYILGKLHVQTKNLSLWGRIQAHSIPVYVEPMPYIYDQQLTKLTGNVQISGFWQHHRYVDQVLKQLRDQLVFPKLKAEISARESVAVHVRRGDYLRSSAFEVCAPSYTHQALTYMRGHLKKPQFYFFSDDLAWCRQEFGARPDTTYIQTADEISDLQCMALCQHHVIANSTFSWWGVRLSAHPGIVIAPQDWCGNQAAAKALILPSWVTIKAS